MILAATLALSLQDAGGFSHRVKHRKVLLERGGGGEATEAAVERALAWLGRHQGDDGFWSAAGYADCCGQCTPTGIHAAVDLSKHDHDVGVTALALLAFLGAGRTHERSDAVLDGLKALLSAQDDDGCVGSRETEQYMYDHAIATLCLAEAYGMTQSRKLQRPAQRAVAFLMAAQNPGKAWRYIYQAGENDSSVTGWAVAALRAAELAGLEFDRAVAFDGAQAWFDQASYREDDRWKVGYQFGADADVAFSGINDRFDQHPTMTAIAVASRIDMERDRRDEKVLSGAIVLLSDLPRWDEAAVDFYYWYWASTALHAFDGAVAPSDEEDASEQARPLVRRLSSDDADERDAATAALIELGAGALAEIEKACASSDLEVAVRAARVRRALLYSISPVSSTLWWKTWNRAMVDALVDHQNTDGDKEGSWEPVGRWCCKGGRVYATAINALTLETYYRYRSASPK